MIPKRVCCSPNPLIICKNRTCVRKVSQNIQDKLKVLKINIKPKSFLCTRCRLSLNSIKVIFLFKIKLYI